MLSGRVQWTMRVADAHELVRWKERDVRLCGLSCNKKYQKDTTIEAQQEQQTNRKKSKLRMTSTCWTKLCWADRDGYLSINVIEFCDSWNSSGEFSKWSFNNVEMQTKKGNHKIKKQLHLTIQRCLHSSNTPFSYTIPSLCLMSWNNYARNKEIND